MTFLMCFVFQSSGNCKYGVDLAKQLISSLYNVLDSCGSVRISFSRRTPRKVGYLAIWFLTVTVLL
jgi:mitochondrial fission protein ELM1